MSKDVVTAAATLPMPDKAAMTTCPCQCPTQKVRLASPT